MAVNSNYVQPPRFMFVKAMDGGLGQVNRYVNINDITSINQVKDNYWEAQGINGKNAYGGPAVYHFDNASANQIINYLA